MILPKVCSYSSQMKTSAYNIQDRVQWQYKLEYYTIAILGHKKIFMYSIPMQCPINPIM